MANLTLRQAKSRIAAAEEDIKALTAKYLTAGNQWAKNLYSCQIENRRTIILTCQSIMKKTQS